MGRLGHRHRVGGRERLLEPAFQSVVEPLLAVRLEFAPVLAIVTDAIVERLVKGLGTSDIYPYLNALSTTPAAVAAR